MLTWFAASKIVGITLPCMYYRIPLRMSLVIGVLMSCKGCVAVSKHCEQYTWASST